MEKEGYRENLEVLLARYPNRMTLTVKEAAAEMGAHINTVYFCIRRVRNPLPHQELCGKIVIPIPAFARWLAG